MPQAGSRTRTERDIVARTVKRDQPDIPMFRRALLASAAAEIEADRAAGCGRAVMEAAYGK